MTCIRYHVWWPSSSDPFYQANISENTARTNYYSVNSVPNAHIDGIINGGSTYSNWGNLIRSRAAVQAPISVTLSGNMTGPLAGIVRVGVEALVPLSFSSLRLFLVITEDGISYGGRIYNQTMRDMIPGASGDPFTLTQPGDTIQREYSFTLNPSWVKDNCNAVVFVQDYASKEILHSAASRITNLALRDVGPTLLLSPGPIVSCDSSYTIQVRVENFGEVTETFDVNCRIDTLGQVVYDETETVTALAPANTYDLTFTPDWHLPVRHDLFYGITFVTRLPQDNVRSNDSLFNGFLARCINDAAPASIVWPGDSVYCGSSSEPRVTVVNLGQIPCGFNVFFSIDTGGVNLFTDTAAVSNLGPAETRDVGFSTWAVPGYDGIAYDLSARTRLFEDSDTSNDVLSRSSWGWCYAWEDVYPSAVVWPVDTVLCDSAGTVRVVVVNAGGFDETFDVVVEIDTNGAVVHSDTASVVDLTAGESAEVAVGGWTVPLLDSTAYGIRFWTMLAADSVEGNDTLYGSFYAYCMRHDCGVEAILAPPDTVSIDSANVPRASVRNWGNLTETFYVVCTIDGYADTQQVAGLLPYTDTEVVFAPWNTSAPGSHLVSVITELVGDQNSQNDTASKTIWGFTSVSDGRSWFREPLVTDLLQNRPNPVTSQTRIEYCVAIAGRASVGIYDAAGRLVRVLTDGEVEPGYYAVVWDGNDEAARPVPSGVYFYKLTAGSLEATRKTVVIR